MASGLQMADGEIAIIQSQIVSFC